MKKIVCLSILLVLASVAHAEVVISPAAQSGPVGHVFTVDVLINGVTAPWLGAFDFTVLYDPAILGSRAFEWYPDPMGGPAAVFYADIISVGSVEIAVTSLESEAVLAGLQATGSFRLGSFGFEGLTAGTSPLTLTNVMLVDASPSANLISMALVDGEITVTGGGGAVPEPTAGLLLLVPAAFAATRLRKRRA